MNRRAKALRETFRRFDCLDRHSGKIDRHENVSNARCFHTGSITLPLPAGSSLIAKDEPFFALRGLAPMQSVPDYRAEKTQYITKRRGYDDQSNGRRRIE